MEKSLFFLYVLRATEKRSQRKSPALLPKGRKYGMIDRYKRKTE
jgi:hypothetical protein